MTWAPPEEWARQIEEDPVAAYRAMFGAAWAGLLETAVPEHTRKSMVYYLILGVMPGPFLEAVLSNDLMESFGRADDINRKALFKICCFLHDAAPVGSFRTPEYFRMWCVTGGALGHQGIAERVGAKKPKVEL